MARTGGRLEEIGEEVGRAERRNEQILRRVMDIGVRAGWSELQSTPLRVVTVDEVRLEAHSSLKWRTTMGNGK